MKKTFLAICTVALGLLAVSCYDDSLLLEKIDKLDERVTKLEQDLNADVANLSALQEKFNGLATTLKKTIEDGDAAVKAALEEKLELVSTELSTAMAAGDQAIIDELLKEKGNLESALTQLQEGLNSAAESVAFMETLFNTLSGKVDDMYWDMETLMSKMDKADKELDGKISDLDAAVKTVKDQLGDLAGEIAEALAKIAVTNVEEKDGKVVLTLATGETIELPNQNVDNEGLVTVVEEEGVKYWAVVVDGKAQSLGVEVGGKANLEFRIQDNCLEYTTDGQEWISTGAYVSEEAPVFIDFYQGDTDEIDWETYEPIKEDFYTFVFGDEVYSLPLYKVDNSTVTIKAGKTYFTYGESKTIDISLSDVTSCYVMTKPDGWKANLAGNKLTVTAPAEANVEAGFAEAEGDVLLHCTTAEGKCKIAKLAVSTTEGFSLTVDAEGNVKIVNPVVVTTTNMWGYENTDFNDAYVGLASIADFEADPLTYVANVGDNWDALFYYLNNWKMNTAEMDEDWNTIFTIGGAYEPGVYEIDVIETTVSQMYADWTYGQEMPRGSQFVVWACPMDDRGMPNTDGLVYGYYTPIDVASELVGDPSFNEINVSVALYGAKEYIVGKVDKEYTFNYNTEEYDLDFYLSDGLNGLAYGYNNLGMTVTESGEFEYALSEVVNDMEESSALMPGRTYFFYIIPVIDGKAWTEYTPADAISYEYTTTALVAGGSASVEFIETEEITFTQLVIDIEGTDGTSMIYYNFFDGDATYSVEDLIAEGYVANDSFTTARDQYLEPGVTRILAAVAVDSEGKYGELVEQDFTTPEIVYSETFTATIGTPAFTSTEKWGSTYYNASIPVTVEGGTAAKYYYYFNTTVRDEEYLKDLPLGSYPFMTATVLGEMNCSTFYAPYQFAVVVESTEGEFSAPVWIMLEKPAAE